MVAYKFSIDDGSVESLIWKNLNFCCYDNALFLAEQQYAHEKTESSVFILATCYHRSNRPNQAKKLLQCSSLTQPMSRYLYAQCCLDTGDLSAAEDALIGTRMGTVAAAATSAAATSAATVASGLFAATTPAAGAQTPQQHDDLSRLGQEFAASEDPAAAGFALKLLGDVYRRTDRGERAAECYRRALAASPGLWVCYEALCSLGEAPDPGDVFLTSMQDASSSPMSAVTAAGCGCGASVSSDGRQDSAASLAMTVSDASASGSFAAEIQATAGAPDAPLRRRPKSGRQTAGACVGARPGGLHSLLEAPPGDTSSATSASASLLAVWDPYATPAPPVTSGAAAASLLSSQALPVSTPPGFLHRAAPGAAAVGAAPPPPPLPAPLPPMSPLGAKENNQGVRTRAQTRSSLAHHHPGGGRGVGGVAGRRSRSIRSGGGKDGSAGGLDEELEKKQQQLQASFPDDQADQRQLQQQQLAPLQHQRSAWLLPLLRQLAVAYRLLSACRWQDAARQLESLPPKLHYSGPALHWLSRAYYEMEDYHGACRLFGELRRRQPWSLRGMDVYSSTLWYLQKEAALSALARELLELDRCTAVEPWCAAGNCFALQKEHEVALKYFRRATQVNPQHAYAFVLLALEYTSVDQLDRALAAFRTAVRLEPRAYNAWYGISNVYFKQEKFALAECHFHKALRIYPNSAVLLTNFGVTKARMGRLTDALDLFTQAKRLSPRMPLCRYQRASVLFSLDRHQEALEELNALRQLTPRESRVFFLLGKVHKAMGVDHQAMVYFNWAMDLDPRGANLQLSDTLDLMTPSGGGGASESDATMEQQQDPPHPLPGQNSLDMEDSPSDQSSDEYDYDAQYS